MHILKVLTKRHVAFQSRTFVSPDWLGFQIIILIKFCKVILVLFYNDVNNNIVS